MITSLTSSFLAATALAFTAGSAVEISENTQIASADAAMSSAAASIQSASQMVGNSAIMAIASQGSVMGNALFAGGSVDKFYKNRNYTAAWLENGRLTRDGRDLIETVETAADHGLNPGVYHLDDLQTLKTSGSLSDQKMAEADVLLTDAFMRLSHDVSVGRIDPSAVDADQLASRKAEDPARLLGDTLERDSVKGAIADLAPKHEQYQRLLKLRAQYADLAEDAVRWTPISSEDLIESGDSDARVIEIRDRFDALSKLDGVEPAPAPLGTADVYDAALQDRVKNFQRSQALEDDGVLGPRTIETMNRGPRERLQAIEMNLERWRWLPDDLGERHVLVNVPQYQAYAYNDGEAEWSMPVIVGDRGHRTPLFSDEIEYMVVNPRWYVPKSIAVNEKLPQLRSNPSRFDRLNYAIYNSNGQRVSPYNVNWSNYSPGNFPFQIVQQPGEKNALGTVKFIFPNDMSIYLHDTDAKSLFDKGDRAMSHGCVRVSDPDKLARWLADGDHTLTYDHIREKWDSGNNEQIDLIKPVPVHLTYFTVWVDDGGKAQFFNDVYERDQRLASALQTSA